MPWTDLSVMDNRSSLLTVLEAVKSRMVASADSASGEQLLPVHQQTSYHVLTWRSSEGALWNLFVEARAPFPRAPPSGLAQYLLIPSHWLWISTPEFGRDINT